MLLGLACTAQQQTRIFRRKRPQPGRFDNPAENALVEIIATERRIPARRQYLKDPAREPED